MTDQPTLRRKLSYEAFTQCWYVPGETHIVDLIHPDDGLTLHYHEEAEAVRGRYPGAERMRCDEAWRAIDAAALARYRKDVSEVTEDRFMDALNVLPPAGWTTRRGVESFRISERLWGNITDIFARLGTRYFTLTDDIRLPADVVADRVHAFITAHPAATLPPSPERPNDRATSSATRPIPPEPGGDA